MRLTKRQEKILNLRKHGFTLAEIGEKFGFTRERARQILVGIERKGIEVPKSASKVKNAKKAKITKDKINEQLLEHNKQKFIKEYKKNFSDIDTAKNLGIEIKVFKAVLNILIKNGELNRRLKIFDPEKYQEEKKIWEEIFAMRNAGYDNKKIARILGTSEQIVSIKISKMKTNGYNINPYGTAENRDYKAEQDDEIIAYRSREIIKLNNEGHSKQYIANKLGIDHRGVYRHIELYMIDY